MSKLVILQTVVPDYRVGFFSFLKQKLGDSLAVFSGQRYFEPSVGSSQALNFLRKTKNHFFLGRRILFQSGMWNKALSADVLVMELNPRIVSNWILLLLRLPSSKRTVLWGHAWSRSGPDSKSEILRGAMRNLADEIIVYTDSERQGLERKMKDKRIHAAPNAIYAGSEMQPVMESSEAISKVICVGRMTKKKKPMLLLRSFLSALDRLPPDAGLIFVGEGEQRNDLERYFKKRASGASASDTRPERVRFLGHISDYGDLKGLYASSLVSVSPGYAGLSLIQSLGFGVPVLVSNNEKHSPEIEAVEEGLNAVFFDTDDSRDLSSKIVDIFENKALWIRKREEISDRCRSSYSLESMAQPFLNLIRD